jgi:dimeric dUTPase (all-alpha-NTP-PPase superfamily)
MNKEATEIISQDTKDEIIRIYPKLIGYKSKNNILYCFVSFINNNKKLKIFTYKIENSKLQFD